MVSFFFIVCAYVGQTTHCIKRQSLFNHTEDPYTPSHIRTIQIPKHEATVNLSALTFPSRDDRCPQQHLPPSPGPISHHPGPCPSQVHPFICHPLHILPCLPILLPSHPKQQEAALVGFDLGLDLSPVHHIAHDSVLLLSHSLTEPCSLRNVQPCGSRLWIRVS